VLLEGNPLEDIANTRQAVKSTQTMVRIAFPIVVVLLLVALVWFIARRARRRKASQVSS
jgi:cytochrome c-type biogenesis protein CcmH/NrfF